MLDFYFTIPYGLLLVVGGVIGYSRKGSTASLAGGAGTGLLLVLAGFLSLQAYNKRTNSYFALILETAIAALLTWVMTQRYLQTSKIMPAGMVAGIRMGQSSHLPFGFATFLMTGFYLYKVANGGNHIPSKSD